jgi:hypothetical protein
VRGLCEACLLAVCGPGCGLWVWAAFGLCVGLCVACVWPVGVGCGCGLWVWTVGVDCGCGLRAVGCVCGLCVACT